MNNDVPLNQPASSFTAPGINSENVRQVASQSAEPPSNGLEFSNDINRKQLFGIFIVNFILSVITLFIYSPWAKTKIRRYIASHTKFMGGRFEYFGTGKELFFGLLFVTLAAILPYFIILSVYEVFLIGDLDNISLSTVLIGIVVYYIIPLFLINIGIYRAFRYRANRTAWRGIRGRVGGSSIKYALHAIWYTFLNTGTLFLLSPITKSELTQRKINNYQFGTVHAQFSGIAAKHFYPKYALYWLLMIPTLGHSWFWYQAAFNRYVAENTKLESLRFKYTAKGWKLLRFTYGNIFLFLFSLGLARPLICHHN